MKGGALIYCFQKEASRPTLDIDLLARNIKADHDILKAAFTEICQLIHSDGVIFDAKSIKAITITKEGNYAGIRIKLLAKLGNIKQTMQVDIGFGDVVTPGPVEMEYPTIIDMECSQLLAYSIESLVAEKFQAMIDLAEYNSRMKDFYDLYTIFSSGEYNEEHLIIAINNTFRKRNTVAVSFHSLFSNSFVKDKGRIVQWKAFLRKSNLNTDLMFSEMMEKIKEVLEPIYKALIK